MDNEHNRFECGLKYIVLVNILIFLFFFFVQIVHVPIYHITDQQEYILHFAEKVNSSMVILFLSVVVFSTIVIAIVFRSNIKLNIKKDQLLVDVGIQEKDFSQGIDGIKKVVDEHGNIPLYNSEVYRQLTKDYIISEVNKEGKPERFITMESYLSGFMQLCESANCHNHNITPQNLKIDKVYAPTEYVQVGDQLLTIIKKMNKNKLSALPVVNKDGVMIGSINYLQVLKLVTDAAKQQKTASIN
ncbi:hypothetical protein Dred_0016 [Desulforamulus reducens MI-1]|uniref:CBS domain-containing protein n=1 Tax=Desulforamulus reducens (strain ATCC BAA-1160 / DSM 100696 / MI-1) TaxID=349161 RepID=A4J0G5_DESRM|nr:CBS domain-containing protein [Desulforamulus reducens]ABO48568.1 hypothetical protein Dred_0016 [Desulforamulus reducens MI-1]